MLAKVLTSAAVILFCAQVSWAQTSQPSKPAAPGDAADAAADLSALVGTWKAKTERLPLTGDFNEQVWGKNAVSVRDVTLTVKSTGDATLTVSRKVLDARGRVVPGSASVEEAAVTVGAAEAGLATRMNHAVKVVKAERRYPDAPADKWTMENLRVNLVSFTDGHDTLEVRFEPSDGQGAFSELLTRQRGAARTAQR